MKLSPLQHMTVIYLMVIIFSYLALVTGKTYIYDENELIENLQALFLGSSCVVFLVSLPGTYNPARILLNAGALFFFSLLLRELDVEKLGLSSLITIMGSGHGRNIILISLWLIVFASMLEQFSWHIEKLWNLLLSRAGVLYIVGGFCLLGGEVTDSMGKSFRFQEEMLEVIGNYLMFVAALYTPQILLKPVKKA